MVSIKAIIWLKTVPHRVQKTPQALPLSHPMRLLYSFIPFHIRFIYDCSLNLAKIKFTHADYSCGRTFCLHRLTINEQSMSNRWFYNNNGKRTFTQSHRPQRGSHTKSKIRSIELRNTAASVSKSSSILLQFASARCIRSKKMWPRFMSPLPLATTFHAINLTLSMKLFHFDCRFIQNGNFVCLFYFFLSRDAKSSHNSNWCKLFNSLMFIKLIVILKFHSFNDNIRANYTGRFFDEHRHPIVPISLRSPFKMSGSFHSNLFKVKLSF